MAGRFDKVARALASDMPRRKVLRMMAGGVTASLSVAVLGKNVTANEGPSSGPAPLLQSLDFNVNCTGFEVITVEVPFINQAGVPYLPGIVEELLPELPCVNWNVIPVPVPVSPGGNGIANGNESQPALNHSVLPPGQMVTIQISPPDQGVPADIEQLIEERLSRVPNVNWNVVQFPRDRAPR